MLKLENSGFKFTEETEKEVLQMMDGEVTEQYATCFIANMDKDGLKLEIDGIYADLNDAMDAVIEQAVSDIADLTADSEDVSLNLVLQDLPIYDALSDVFILIDADKKIVGIMPAELLRRRVP